MADHEITAAESGSQAMQSRAQRQFSLRSLLVTTVTIGMVLGYVKLTGADRLQLVGLGLLGAVIWGGALGLCSGRLMETIVWSLVGGALALCCVLSGYQVTEFQQLYWLSVGTIGGAFAGYVAPGKYMLRLVWAFAVWVPFALVSTFGGDGWNGILDSALALPVLIGLMFLAELVDWLQRRYHTALDVWALGLVFAVIAGNFGAVVVWNLWYT